MTAEVEARTAVAGQNIDPPAQVHIATEVQTFFCSAHEAHDRDDSFWCIE